MGNAIGSFVKGLSVDAESEEKLLRKTFDSAIGMAEKQAASIEQMLRIAGSKDDNGLTVPVSNVFSKNVVARVQSNKESKPESLMKSIVGCIETSTAGNITAGVTNLLADACGLFFDAFKGTISQETQYFVVMIGRSLVRVDLFMYTEVFATKSDSRQINVVVAYRSPVDLSRLSLSSFMCAYQYELPCETPLSSLILQCNLFIELFRLNKNSEKEGASMDIERLQFLHDTIGKYEVELKRAPTIAYLRSLGLKPDAAHNELVEYIGGGATSDAIAWLISSSSSPAAPDASATGGATAGDSKSGGRKLQLLSSGGDFADDSAAKSFRMPPRANSIFALVSDSRSTKAVHPQAAALQRKRADEAEQASDQIPKKLEERSAAGGSTAAQQKAPAQEMSVSPKEPTKPESAAPVTDASGKAQNAGADISAGSIADKKSTDDSKKDSSKSSKGSVTVIRDN